MLASFTELYFYLFQEEYVEYSRQGNVIKGQEKAPVKSKYEEDVYNNNHTVSLLERSVFQTLFSSE